MGNLLARLLVVVRIVAARIFGTITRPMGAIAVTLFWELSGQNVEVPATKIVNGNTEANMTIIPQAMSLTQKYEGYKWVKVKRHTDDPSKTWEERFRALEEHHIKETTFLVDEVRKLAAEIDQIKKE